MIDSLFVFFFPDRLNITEEVRELLPAPRLRLRQPRGHSQHFTFNDSMSQKIS